MSNKLQNPSKVVFFPEYMLTQKFEKNPTNYIASERAQRASRNVGTFESGNIIMILLNQSILLVK